MAQQTINVGTVANDGTGDTIRGAMNKVNANFTEMYDKFSPIESSTNANLSLLYCDSDGKLNPILGIKFNPTSGELRFDSTGTPGGSTITVTDNDNTNLYVVEYGSSSSTYPSISLSKRRGNIDAQLDCEPGDIVGSYSAFGGVSGSVYSVGSADWLATTPTDGRNNSTFRISTKVNGTLGTRFAIGDSGQVIVDSIQFSDSTVQTTAASSGLSTVDVPASSFGSSGDQEGDLAFSSTHMYYCSADHTEVTWDNTATVDIAGGDGVSSGIAVTLSVVPSVGWAISDGTTTATITQVVPQGSWYVLLWDNAITFAVGDTVYYGATAPAQDHIWKRVSWSNDTW
jgi:hypothetical protein